MSILSRACRRCNKNTRQEISCRVNSNLAEHYGYWCLECRWWVQNDTDKSYWIPKETILSMGIDLSTIRVVERINGERCSRCGRHGAELHHWAPCGIFGRIEADLWPKDFLCKECHDLWHTKVTPSLVGKKPI